MAGVAQEVGTRRVPSESPSETAAGEKGSSSMFLIYSFAASKEENAVKKSKLRIETELCQVVPDDGCF